MAMRWTPDVGLAEEGLGCLGIRWGKEGEYHHVSVRGEGGAAGQRQAQLTTIRIGKGANDVAQTWHTQSQLAFHSSYFGT